MRVHLVHAHPSPDSFSRALRDRVVETLEAQGHAVDVLDLYAEGFDPVLSLRDWAAYLDPGANRGVGPEVERLRHAEALVLCFPTWWYGLPAILKGWFDRVWTPGVAFHLPHGGGPIRRGLVNIRHLMVVTTYGSPGWFIALGLGNPGRAVLMRGMARLIAPDAATRFVALYDMDAATPARRARFLARVERAARSFGR
jgi:NAD(P)H dehydrogenase (quinone)